MADLDLSLSDALTDSGPPAGQENLVQRDFVASLEAEAYDDQVGETVGKKDYIPLLDDDDKKKDAGSAVTLGGLKPAQRPEPQGEVRPHSTEQQVFATDFLSGPMMSGFGNQWDSQPIGSQIQGGGLMGPFPGFSQPGLVNMDVGMAPFQTERPPSIAEPQKSPLSLASEPPKHPPLDSTTGLLGDPWEGHGGLQADFPFTSSVSTVISRHANQLAGSPPDPQWPPHQSTGAGEEREGEAADRKQQQKKKKKRRPREEVYDFQENRGPLEDSQGPQAENMPPADGQHRRRDEGWERDDWGRSGGRGKKGKSRKKFPDEWAMLQDPPLPSAQDLGFHSQEMVAAETHSHRSLAHAHPPAAMDTSGPGMPDPLLYLADDSLPLDLDDDLVPGMPSSLSQDLLSLTASLSPEPLPAGPTATSPSPGTPKETPHPQSPGLGNSFSLGGTGTPVAPFLAAGSPHPGKAEEGFSLLPSDLFATDTPPSTDSEALPPSPKGEQAQSMPIQKAALVPSYPPPSKESPLSTPTSPQTDPLTDKMVPAASPSESPYKDDIFVSGKDSPLAPVEGELASPSKPSDDQDPLSHTDTPVSPMPEEDPDDTSVLLSSSSPRPPKEAQGQKRKQPKKPRSTSAKSPTSPDRKPAASPTSPALSPSAPTPPAPPAGSSLSALAAPFPGPNWELNPTAPPFIPNLADEAGGPADPSLAEVAELLSRGFASLEVFRVSRGTKGVDADLEFCVSEGGRRRINRPGSRLCTEAV
ncbi:uncharacterized protein LOC133125973 [Conger conger]|uniref:uncharacterized protein LOC133125973 n=1 Tax=Conger conger TaxID=82655 RepID=UPI002A5ACEFA|nr:uncharacterized protein LOC133125973 [Conger conger]